MNLLSDAVLTIETPLGRHPSARPHSGRYPPWADTPLSDTPRADTPVGRQPPPGSHPLGRPPGRHPLPSACWDTHTPAQCMLGYTHPPSACWDTPSPPQRPLQQTVCILLKCILVLSSISAFRGYKDIKSRF